MNTTFKLTILLILVELIIALLNMDVIDGSRLKYINRRGSFLVYLDVFDNIRIYSKFMIDKRAKCFAVDNDFINAKEVIFCLKLP